MRRWLQSFLVAGLLTGPAAAQEADENVKRDLFTVITLQGKPCGRVVSADRRGESDYVVRCETGERYRVRLDAEGRVVIERL